MGLALVAPLVFACSSTLETNNKAIVTTFYNEVFVAHHAKVAAETYLSVDYKQHNPNIATGRQPFIDYFVPYFAANPTAHSEIKRILANGDLVAVHVHSKTKPEDLGVAIVDIFRVQDGKIVEHWDVIQPVSATPANNNTMF
jgi:predicted SnoaL-like aldol condensation-catalyzing enzyme